MKWFDAVSGVAAAQHGLCTRDQVRDLGVSRHQLERAVADGVLVRVQPRVYAVGGMPDSPQRAVLAACLSVDGLASHRSAGRLWGVPIPGPVRPEIVLVGSRGRRLTGVTVHRTDVVDRRDRTVIDGVPTTALARTVLDLGAVLRPWDVERAMEDAVLRLGTSIRALRDCLDRTGGNGRRGTAVLRAILDARDPALPAAEGALNLALERVLRRHGLRSWAREHRLRGLDGERVRLDIAWPDAKVGIEGDSRRWHAGRFDVERNARKANVLASLGWLVLRYTWTDVRFRRTSIGTQASDMLARRAA